MDEQFNRRGWGSMASAFNGRRWRWRVVCFGRAGFRAGENGTDARSDGAGKKVRLVPGNWTG